MPPTPPYPGHRSVAVAVRNTVEAEIGGDEWWGGTLGLNLLQDMQETPVGEVAAAVSPEVTTDYGTTGWDGDTFFYVTFAEPPKGAHGVRTFRVTVAETDHDDMP